MAQDAEERLERRATRHHSRPPRRSRRYSARAEKRWVSEFARVGHELEYVDPSPIPPLRCLAALRPARLRETDRTERELERSHAGRGRIAVEFELRCGPELALDERRVLGARRIARETIEFLVDFLEVEPYANRIERLFGDELFSQ